MNAFHAFAAVVLAAILVRQWFKLHRESLDRATGRHASREAIRQQMHADRWSTGEMPDDGKPRDSRSRLGRPLPPPRWIPS
jgi:hypothetical protein